MKLVALLAPAAAPAQAAPVPASQIAIAPTPSARLQARLPLCIACFGGSITEGAGASREGSIHRVHYALVPQCQSTEVNASIGGTGSDLGAFRLARDVLDGKPDLPFVEFAANDGSAPTEQILRASEGIVRQEPAAAALTPQVLEARHKEDYGPQIRDALDARPAPARLGPRPGRAARSRRAAHQDSGGPGG